MKVTFLGTGTSQGVPVIACSCEVCRSIDPHDHRLRTSVMIEEAGNVFVIDTGPDFRQQMLRESVTNLTAVLFTHEHKDHVAGMDDVRAFNFQLKKHIDVYASERVQQALKREYAYIFAEETYPGIPQINLHEITDQPFAIEGVTFTPIQVWHHRLPVLGFRVGDFTYITDANRIDEAERAKIRGSKVVVLNALRQEPHLSHFNLEQAVEVMEDLQPERGYFIHISHLMGKHRHAERGLPDFVRIAYDGLAISL